MTSSEELPELNYTQEVRLVPDNPISNRILQNSFISDNTAIRLYNSVRLQQSPVISDHLLSTNVSWLSLNETSNVCRICRYKRTDTSLIECPCKCSGTMGHIHVKCLQRWMRVRKDDHCEICKEIFNFPQNSKNYQRLLIAFFQPRYIGACLKIILNFVSLSPLVYFTMNQLISTIESIHGGSPTKVLIVGPTLLLATSAYFFFYFEWALTCIFRLNNIIYHWWNFGDQDDDDYGIINEYDSDPRFFDH